MEDFAKHETVLIFGLQLGVTWDTEPLFFKLIERALNEVPFVFEVSVDPETKAPYFYNRVSGSSSWNHPRRDEYRQLLKELRQDFHEGKDEIEALIGEYIFYTLRNCTFVVNILFDDAQKYIWKGSV